MNAEFEALWQEFLDGNLEPDGFTRLDAMLRVDAELTRHAATLYEEHRLIALALRQEPEQAFSTRTLAAAQAERREFAAKLRVRLEANHAERAAIKTSKWSGFWKSWRWPLVAATGVVAGLAIALIGWRPTPSGAAGNAAAMHIATLVWTDHGRWSSRSHFDGERLRPGLMELTNGASLIRFDSGALVAVSGPTRVELQARGSASLHEGSLTVRASSDSMGFTVRTPAGEFELTGQECAVLVTAGGVTEAHALEGQVEFRPAGVQRSVTVIAAGRALRFDRPAAGQSRDLPAAAPRFDEIARGMRPSFAPGRLVAYEGFEYAPGEYAPDAVNGGTGWAGAWRLRSEFESSHHADSANHVKIVSDSLTAPRLAPSRGGRMEFAPGENYRIRRLATPLELGRDGVYYISVLVRQEAELPNVRLRGRDVSRITFRSLRDYWGHSVGLALRPSRQAQLGIGGGNTFNSTQVFPAGQTLLFVCKISAHASGEDEVFLRVYAENEAIDAFEPADWTVATRGFFSEATLDQIVLTGIGAASRSVDEIRIGTSWLSVAPAAQMAVRGPDGLGEGRVRLE